MSVDAEIHGDAAHVGHVAMPSRRKGDPFDTRWGKFLQACIKVEASDLIMKSETQPKLRVRGSLKPLDCEPIGGDEFYGIAKAILSDEQIEDLHKFGSVDFAYDYDDNNRFRVNLFQARGKLSVAARLITAHIRKFDDRPVATGGVNRNWWTYLYNKTVTDYTEEPNDLMRSAFLSNYIGPNEGFAASDIRSPPAPEKVLCFVASWRQVPF